MNRIHIGKKVKNYSKDLGPKYKDRKCYNLPINSMPLWYFKMKGRSIHIQYNKRGVSLKETIRALNHEMMHYILLKNGLTKACRMIDTVMMWKKIYDL